MELWNVRSPPSREKGNTRVKLLALAYLLLVCFVSSAVGQVPYVATSGDITLTVMAWSNAIPAGIIDWKPVPVTGTWINACTSNQLTSKLQAIINYKNGSESVKTIVDFSPLHDSGTGLRCGSILTLTKRESVLNVTVITASTEFLAINGPKEQTQ